MTRLTSCWLLVTLVLPGLLNAHPIQESLQRFRRQAEPDNECNQGDVVFVLDSSGSIGQDNWEKVKDFVKEVVEGLEIGPYDTKVGCITYGTKATPNFYLNTHQTKQGILDAVSDITWKDQETNTSGALWFMSEIMFTAENGDRPLAPNLAIVITDGESNRDAHFTIPYAEQINEKGLVTMFAIGVGDLTKQEELEAIASNLSYIFSVEDFSMLPEINSKIVSAACDIPVECKQNADITFILDTSSSMRYERFDQLKVFVSELVDEINVDVNQSNVGLITFSDEPQIEIQLDQYHVRQDLKDAIMEVTYRRGSTNTADALRMACNQMFNSGAGDRSVVQNIIMLFTDGNSNDMSRTLREAQICRSAGVTIVAVAVTDWIQFFEVEEIASDPDNMNAFMVKNMGDISTIKQDLKAILCDKIDECGGKPCQNGGTCLNLINAYKCICPSGFAGMNCEYGCSAVDVVMAIDSSGSIGRDNFYTLLDFAKDLSDSLNYNGDEAARLGVETFANENEIRFHLKEHTSKMAATNAISFLYNGGTTNTAAALADMTNVMFTSGNGQRSGIRNVGITITDGESDDRDTTYERAKTARQQDITMLAVGINIKGSTGQLELQGIASDPDEKNVMNVNDFGSLGNLTDTLVQAICNTVNECASDPCQNGGECVDKTNGYECVCRTQFSGRHCERGCDGRADIVFVVDSSGSIRQSRFQLVRDYMKSVVNEMEIASDKVRVALVQFSDDAEVKFYLNTHNTREDVLQDIQRLKYTRGRTHTSAALRMLRENIFLEVNGDRFDAPNYAVLITDGQSTVDSEMTIPEAIQDRIYGIHLIAVAVGPKSKSLEIRGIASDPDEYNIYSVENFSELASKSMPLVNAMCDTINECDDNPCQNNGECINGLGQYICACEDEFTGYNCERHCTNRADVVFVLDASGSVEKNFELALNLTRHIVQGLNFVGSRTQVGLLTYSDSPQVRFHLNEHKRIDDVQNAIAFTLMGGRTNTYSGLHEMRMNMFTALHGERSGNDNYGIVITDGNSNVNAPDTLSEAANVRGDDIHIFAVGIGKNGQVDRSEINGIASDPDNSYAFMMQEESDLVKIADSILDKICE